jgi:two-component system, NtrC family, sensor kinase
MRDPSDWRILLIDDEQDILDVVGLALKDAGYQIATAPNGEAGLAACAEDPPHIVITDIRMPGINGIQVLARIKERHPFIEVIVATAFGEMELAVQALQLDASDFITKPIAADALLVAVERAKQRHTARRKLQDYAAFLEAGWAETNRELLETYRYQQKLIESSIDGILGCDADEHVVTFNRSMETMFGFRKSEILHRKTLADFFEASVYRAFHQDLASGNSAGKNRLFLYETRMRTKQGTFIPVQLSAEVFSSSRGPEEGLVCFIRDLRQIRRLEQQMAHQAHILHQDKMMSLGRLAASVAHEINNPLSGVLNYIRLMSRIVAAQTAAPKETHKFKSYLGIVENEIQRCARIVANLLTFARTSDIIFKAVDVRALIEQCLVLSGHRLQLGNIETKIDVNEPLPAIQGDANQLQQCLINLVFNAIDAMPDGGLLEIKARSGEDRSVVVISVTDNGCGIAPENLARLFDPFFTTKQEGQGTGLGLSTTYGIIEKHKGTIDAHSRLGHGTTFTIKLPVTE